MLNALTLSTKSTIAKAYTEFIRRWIPIQNTLISRVLVAYLVD